MSKKKNELLGMNSSTASGRLVKDLLFNFVDKSGIKCLRCGEKMTRDTFSVDHIESWQRSNNPTQSFFDLDNISYSHKSCNSSAAFRKKAAHGGRTRYESYKCRCAKCVDYAKSRNWPYDPEKRRNQYLRTGK